MPRSAHAAHCQTLAVRPGRRRQRAGGLPCKCSARALHLLGEPDGGLRRRGRPWNPEGRWKAPIDGAFTPGPGLAGRLHDQRRHPGAAERIRWNGASAEDSFRFTRFERLVSNPCDADVWSGLAAQRSGTEFDSRRPFLTAAPSPTRSATQRSGPIDRSRWSGPDVSESSLRATASHRSRS